MINAQSQIKINLSATLKKHLTVKAQKFGMPVAGYVKHLILEDVKEEEYPTFEASDATIRAYKKALKEEDKAIRVTGDIKTFLENI